MASALLPSAASKSVSLLIHQLSSGRKPGSSDSKSLPSLFQAICAAFTNRITATDWLELMHILGHSYLLLRQHRIWKSACNAINRCCSQGMECCPLPYEFHHLLVHLYAVEVAMLFQNFGTKSKSYRRPDRKVVICRSQFLWEESTEPGFLMGGKTIRELL